MNLLTVKPQISAQLFKDALGGQDRQAMATKATEQIMAAIANKGLPLDMVKPIMVEIMNGLYSQGFFLCGDSAVNAMVEQFRQHGIHMAYWENASKARQIVAYVDSMLAQRPQQTQAVPAQQAQPMGNPMAEQNQPVVSDAPPSATSI